MRSRSPGKHRCSCDNEVTEWGHNDNTAPETDRTWECSDLLRSIRLDLRISILKVCSFVFVQCAIFRIPTNLTQSYSFYITRTYVTDVLWPVPMDIYRSFQYFHVCILDIYRIVKLRSFDWTMVSAWLLPRPGRQEISQRRVQILVPWLVLDKDT